MKIFICHAKEDKESALRLYDDLKDAGLFPWISDIDLKPGVKWEEIIPKTIKDCTFFIALFSSHFNREGYLNKEIKIALDLQNEQPCDSIFILPIRLDNSEIKHPEIKKLHKVDLFPSYQKGFNSILEAFGGVKIVKKNVWLTDADNINFTEISPENLVFINKNADEFLYSNNKLCIIATKGFGKTLLLKFKKYNILKDSKAITVPSKDVLDTISFPINLDDDVLALLEKDHHSWKNIWEFSFKLSFILAYVKVEKKENILEDLLSELDGVSTNDSIKPIKTLIKELIIHINHKNEKSSVVENKIIPSKIINELLLEGPMIFEYIYNVYLPKLNNYLTLIDREISIFIDRIDHKLREQNDNIWYNSQIGLLETVYNLNRANRRLKVYCSIRHEAFASYKSENFLQISDIITELKYSKHDLMKIFSHAIDTYESKDHVKIPDLFLTDPIKAFTGYEYIFNKYSGVTEKIFEYIRRHTLGRPRELMLIGSELHRHQNTLSEEQIIDIVNKKTSEEIERGYFMQIKRFLKALKKEERIHDLFRLLSRNILNFQELSDICRVFNKKEACTIKCENCKNTVNPFCELYNTGLLGVTKKNIPFNKKVQHFLKSHQMSSPKRSINHIPKESSWYLIHPGILEYINKINESYYSVQGIVVGDGYDWREINDILMEIDTIGRSLKKSYDYEISCIEKLKDAAFCVSNKSFKDDCFNDLKDINEDRLGPFFSNEISHIIKSIKQRLFDLTKKLKTDIS